MKPRQTANNRIVGLVVACVAAAMVGMAYAAVPLYKLYCRTTGFGGTTQVARTAPAQALAQRVNVSFDANVDQRFPWRFAPEQRHVTVRIGEQKLIFYRAHNPSDRPLVGTATYNVTPEIVGRYFNKIQCFCFNQQRLEPGQTVDMPVVFFVDPAILKDPQARSVSEITLSYTFFEVEKPEQPRQQLTAITPATAKAADRATLVQ